ncbi:MAG: tetratricopeptide repeat protein, partial [Acidobacteriota bacterium]
VGYMSPEQIRGVPAEATSDIFSYGCVLYEMVAGKRPFGGATVPEAMAAILRDPAPSASDAEHSVPAELDRVIAHCLEKEPTRRFQSERSLWAESFERDLKDVFTLQSEVATAIVKQIGAKLTSDAAARLAPRTAVAPEAYEAYLKAEFYRQRFDAESLDKAKSNYEKAIRIAPEFASPYAGLAFYHSSSAVEGAVAPKLAFPQAEAAATKALDLDPDLPEGHSELGWIQTYFHWNLEAAEREFRRAAELNGRPQVGANGLLARYRGDFNRAIEVARATLEREPLELDAHLRLGTAYSWAGQYDKALEVYRKGLEIHPDSSEAHELLADAYAMKGSHGEAIGEQKRALGLANLDDWAEELGRDFAALGWEKAQRNLARKRLDEMTALAKEGRYVSPLNLAALHTLLGEKEETFRWLDKAVEERSPFLIALSADPQWNSIRSDPRFGKLASRVVPTR